MRLGRRRFLRNASALALAWPHSALPQARTDLPIADAHSHIGVYSPGLAARNLKAEMQAAGVMLLSWNIVGDGRWTARTRFGIEQRSTPASGEQAAYFRRWLDIMRKYLAGIDLPYVRSPADIDAARSGTPHVVIAIEGAGFAADGPGLLEKFHGDGLRHVQLVHYIRNALGDFQTEAPQHNGLTQAGVDMVKDCNRLGILVDLAHATGPAIDKALEVSSAPMIWSHSALTTFEYSWRHSPNQSRLLHLDYAKKIARRGGAVGLWNLRASVGSSPSGYATELMRMADAIGPEHVMFGTDLDGVGELGTMDRLGDLRKVAEVLAQRRVDEKTLRAVCFENYARCLRTALQARPT